MRSATVQSTLTAVGSATFCSLLAQKQAVARDGMMKAAVETSSGVAVTFGFVGR